MEYLEDITDLEDLWNYTSRLHKNSYPESELAPIMGGGKYVKPDYMFVFINPTYRNVSSSPKWEGKRRPWTGTKYIWKIFNRAGHLDDDILRKIEQRRDWNREFADCVYEHLSDRGFYFTNIVKWTGENADLPNSAKIKTFLPILLKEIELVMPRHIVTFGLIPFNALIKEKIKLSDYFDEVMKKNELGFYDLAIKDAVYKVIPSYFPVGRGNPTRAVQILSMLP